jgi:hypothetical protein
MFGSLRRRAPERRLRNPPILTANLRLVLLEPRGRRTENREVHVDQDLGIEADGLHGVAREHDQIVDPLRALRIGAQLSRGGARPLRAPLLVVVTSSVVDRVVEPEAHVNLGRVLGQRDDVADLLEALDQVLRRVVVAMRLGVSAQNIAVKAPELRGIADTELAPGLEPSPDLGHIRLQLRRRRPSPRREPSSVDQCAKGSGLS